MKIVRLIKRFPTFIKEVKSELKKVNWPTRKDLVSATIVVLIGSLFLTIYIAIVDGIFLWLSRKFFSI